MRAFEPMYVDVLLDDDHTDIAGALEDAKAALLAKGFDLRKFDVQIRLRHLTDAEHLRRLALLAEES